MEYTLDDLACVIYVYENKNASLEEVMRSIWNSYTQTILALDNELITYKNYDFKAKYPDFPDGFLYFSHRIEVFPNKLVSLENQIKLVSIILQSLWDKGIPAVASCDYENKLPFSGGYNQPQLPWPIKEQ